MLMSFFIVITLVTLSFTFVSLSPKPSDNFMALFTLDKDGKTLNYYPNNDTDLRPGEELQWYVGVYNHMGSIQYIALRFKLLNNTLKPPDITQNTPSPSPPFIEIRHVLLNNETWITPVDWSIANATGAQGDVRINSVAFNALNITENLGVSAERGYNFRIVMELWVYSPESGQFLFTWMSGNQTDSAWNQLWFNSTTIPPVTVTVPKVTMTVSYQVNGGGSGYSAPTFSYVQGGVSKQLTLTNTPTAVDVDKDSSWSVSNPLKGSTGSERWWTSQPLKGKASSSETINFVYQHQYHLTMNVSPSIGGTVTPVSGWQNSGATVNTQATPSSSFTFLSWTGSGTGSYTGTLNPSSVTMNGPITETANFLS
jgi:hypothetical protein